MSSGLLYLAIVGVWALVLVPMWLRGYETNDRGRADRDGTRLLSRRPPPGGRPAGPRGAPPGGRGGPPGRPPPDGGVPGPAAARPPTPSNARYGAVPARVRPPPADPPAAPSVARPAAASAGRLPGGRRRARVIARRRRRLFGITLLLVGALILAASGFAPWWVAGPPAGLLVGYLALLHAARQVDLERARMLAEAWSAGDPAAAAVDEGAYDEAPAEVDPGRRTDGGADVIPLTAAGQGRDEPYDQYADAGLRAVGD